MARFSIDEVQSRLDHQMDRVLRHARDTENLVIQLGPEEFREALANAIIRGGTKVSELIMWHNGRRFRIQCDGDPIGFTMYTSGDFFWQDGGRR